MAESTPPVCSYEGSNYQASFWDQGNRAYEDAAEATALRRMLPPFGKRMLELGAGAGRNSTRYPGFEQIVLVDYSHTQLEQARDRLGRSRRYIYVAADVYHLPFTTGLFDGATMIRTLHHMADAPLAIQQVERVMQTNGIFILEYASKRNLKSIARWLLRRQQWSPFSPEPLEFVKLNYDFHPGTVHGWLRDAGFETERILTVSHLRAMFFKKTLPLSWMVAMDSLFSLTGNWWQLTPSVFTRNRALRQKPPAMGFFCCPACGSERIVETEERLTCEQCRRNYPISNGIYDFRLDQAG